MTGPATPPLGEGSFRYDTGAPGAAAAGAKVELSNGSLNDQPVANLTGLRFDAYVEENDAGASAQPYVNLKVDADNNGSIDTTLSLRPHRDPAERLDHGRHVRRHRHRSVRLALHVDGGHLRGVGHHLGPDAGPAPRWRGVPEQPRLPQLADPSARAQRQSAAGRDGARCGGPGDLEPGRRGGSERLRARADQRGRQHRRRAHDGHGHGADRGDPQWSQQLLLARRPAGRPPRPAGHGELRHRRRHRHGR